MNKLILQSILVIAFLVFPGVLFAQSAPYITGKVIDGESGEPLMLANIYLSNTFTGTTSNENGEYILHNVEPGIYKLIVSYIGYDSQIRNIRIDAAREYEFHFKLGRKPFQAGEIVVEGRKPKDWDKNLKKFKKYFLEYSTYARDCKLINPYVLSFENDRDSKLFNAKAEDILIIENHALGYKINYMLISFSVKEDIINYWGEPFFELMTPENAEQQDVWKKNRETAYRGSFRHFLRTLVLSITEEEGFDLKLLDDLPPDNFTTIPIEDPAKLCTKINDNLYQLHFDEFLEVVYRPGKFLKEVRQFVEGTLLSRYEEAYPTSYLVLKQHPVLFDAQGILHDPFKSLPVGTWLNYRIGELLPREYRPDNDWN